MSILVATPIDAGELFAARVTLGWTIKMIEAIGAGLVEPERVLVFARDVVRARNRAVAKALARPDPWTHVLWWDEDQWPEDVHTISRLVAADVDVVGAPYWTKSTPGRWTHQDLRPAPAPVGSLQETRFVGFGFTLVKRGVLERMWSTCRKYSDAPNPLKCSDMFGQLYEATDLNRETYTPEDEEALLSEDYSFCARWRRMGGKVHVLLDSGTILHAGMHAWPDR